MKRSISALHRTGTTRACRPAAGRPGGAGIGSGRPILLLGEPEGVGPTFGQLGNPGIALDLRAGVAEVAGGRAPRHADRLLVIGRQDPIPEEVRDPVIAVLVMEMVPEM